MRLETISVRNFRQLRRLSINLATDKTATVPVGPNNSGKTSVMDAFRLFVGSGGDANYYGVFTAISQASVRECIVLVLVMSDVTGMEAS